MEVLALIQVSLVCLCKMKSYVEVRDNGVEFNKEFSKVIIEEFLRDQGIKVDGSKDFSLWGVPRDYPQLWYIVTGGYRKRIVRHIPPKSVCFYVSKCLNKFIDEVAG